MRTCLYLDDVRTPILDLPKAHPWVVVRNYDEFVAYIEANGIPDVISFDHDLGEEHMKDYFTQLHENGWQNPDYDSYTEKTGLDCAKWLCDYCLDKNLKLNTVIVHSHNPVGGDNIQRYINNFKAHVGDEQDCFIMRIPYKIEENGEEV